MSKRTLISILTMMTAAILLWGVLAAAMTSDEIFDRMDEEADLLAKGSMVSTIRFDNTYGDGTTASNLFGSIAKPNFSLIYFIEPTDVQGTIFLTHETEEEGAENRLWLYLPILGIPKELVSEEERGGSFAGSSLSYEDLGDDDRRNDYDAVLLGEEELIVGDRTRTVYKIESTAKTGADVDTLRTVLWIDTEFFIMLRMEGYNDLGNLESTMQVLALGEFEGKLTAGILFAENVTEESSTTVTILDQHRPEAEIADDVFAPENLTAFDPAEWGF